MPRTSFLAAIAASFAFFFLHDARAGGKLVPGTAHDPPRFVDESTTWVTLIDQGEGYGFQVHADMLGYGTKADRIRVDWKQGGKVLASAKCEVPPASVERTTAECTYRAPSIKAKGAVEAELVYADDKDDKEYLVRTYKVTALQWGPKKIWQIAPDDLLGAAHALHHENSGRPWFQFWVAGPSTPGPAALRCTVDGKPLPEIEAAIQAEDRIDADVIPPKGEREKWVWSTFHVAPAVHYGNRRGADPNVLRLMDHPGQWDCMVRRGGRNLRELLFKVDAQGMVESHPMQKAAGAVPLFPGVALVDIRIPKDAALDQRIKPTELKRSRGFGLPWPNDPGVKAIHAALPPAFEDAHPKPPPKPPAGKPLPGAAHDPPRFVDESTTEITLVRNGDGYKFKHFALVTGYSSRSDATRLDWKQGGKVIASAKCGAELAADKTADVRCEYDGKPITAKGAIEADLVYSDDTDGKDYLLRTYRVTAARFPSNGDAVWQILGDDLLGAAWVRHQYPQVLQDAYAGHPQFFFWVTHRDDGFDLSLRCTVGSKTLRDIKMSTTQTYGRLEMAAVPRTRSGTPTEYIWLHVRALSGIYFGKRSDYANVSKSEEENNQWLGDAPGAWDCQVRSAAKPIRQLLFTVDDKGFIVTDPMQQGKGAPPTLSNVAAIDIRIPKGAGFDARIRPEAMRKSRGFGLAWPDAPNVKAIHAAFPPATGLPDPK